LVALPVGAPTVRVDSIVNGARFGSPGVAAPGSIVSLFGVNLGQLEILNAFPATDLYGQSVTFNGVAAPLFAVVPSRNQINVLVPAELPETGTVLVRARMAFG